MKTVQFGFNPVTGATYELYIWGDKLKVRQRVKNKTTNKWKYSEFCRMKLHQLYPISWDTIYNLRAKYSSLTAAYLEIIAWHSNEPYIIGRHRLKWRGRNRDLYKREREEILTRYTPKGISSSIVLYYQGNVEHSVCPWKVETTPMSVSSHP